jgi:hypothetical protein
MSGRPTEAKKTYQYDSVFNVCETFEFGWKIGHGNGRRPILEIPRADRIESAFPGEAGGAYMRKTCTVRGIMNFSGFGVFQPENGGRRKQAGVNNRISGKGLGVFFGDRPEECPHLCLFAGLLHWINLSWKSKLAGIHILAWPKAKSMIRSIVQRQHCDSGRGMGAGGG